MILSANPSRSRSRSDLSVGQFGSPLILSAITTSQSRVSAFQQSCIHCFFDNVTESSLVAGEPPVDDPAAKIVRNLPEPALLTGRVT